MKKVLIIGGSGFLGSHIADIFTKKKYHVTIFDKVRSPWIKNKQKMIVSNLSNAKKLEQAIKNSDFVYHFAAMSDIGDCQNNPQQSARINILFTLKVLKFCTKYKIKRLVYSSTIYIHSAQGGFYRISKQASELYIEEYNKRYSLDYTIIRFGTVYGPRSSKKNNLTKIISNALKQNVLKYSGGTSSAVRRYINVIDAAKASCEILNKKFKNKNVLITGREKIKITEIMKSLSTMLKIKSKPKYEKITEYGHYNASPYTYKKKPEIKYFPRRKIEIKQGLTDLVNELINKKY
jgi:UDP-glucose 4-epimerase